MDVRLIIMIIFILILIATTALMLFSMWIAKRKWISKSGNVQRKRSKF